VNSLEHQLQYPLGDTLPAPGTALEIAPGVKWVRMPLPFALDHINLWLLADEVDGRAGWTIVDCCIARDDIKALWEQVFATALDGKPVLRVVVTHMHPDHVGLAHWLCERWNAPLHMSMTDYAIARLFSQHASGPGGEQAAAHFARHGLNDPESIAKIKARAAYYPGMVPAMPASFRRLLDGQRLAIGANDWHTIAGYGHAPEHMSLHAPGLGILIAGDMLLPRISTNVSVFDTEPEADPLPLFLQSIERFRPLPADTLVLPSHGKPFRGIAARLDQLKTHHEERLAEVLAACATPQSAADIVPVLFRRPLDLHQMTFALGEALAHLHALWYGGQLARQEAHGVYRFVRR
jgi:glyoxylase-like metal-dependent hydrolase (beta-lactamase superfamily II)